MKLSLEAIQIIDAIDRTGSMSGAAELLHRVPSTISYSIGKLEEQLNIKLFDPNDPKGSLTAAGNTLLQEARLLFHAFGDLESRLHKIASGYESELRIVFDSLLPSSFFINDLHEFNALQCGTRIRLTVETMGGVWEALREERADIIIAIGDRPNWSGYQVRQIDSVEFVFCVSPVHPLATAVQPVKTELLHQHTVIVVADSARSLPAKTVGLLSGQKRITVPNIDTKIQFQRAGLGFGFLPKVKGVAIFAKACFGHPSPSKRQKLNATANACGCPSRPASLVLYPARGIKLVYAMTRRDVGMLCIFTPQKTLRENAQRYRFWGLLGFPPRSD